MDKNEEEGESEQEGEEDDLMVNASSANPKKGGGGGVVRCEFNEVKLCSKNGAFLISKEKGNYLYFSTQNSRVKGEVDKQKMQI